MYRKLVRHDQRHFCEVDPVRLKRVAILLRDEINRKVEKTADIYGFYLTTLPFVEAAIRGEITDSLDLDAQDFIPGNYRHDENEGILPPTYDENFTDAVTDFRVTAEALSLENWDPIVIDGLTYGWVDFEEEGDWPDKVKHR